MQISVVIPLFNEEESLPELHQWIQKVMDKELWEVSSSQCGFCKSRRTGGHHHGCRPAG